MKQPVVLLRIGTFALEQSTIAGNWGSGGEALEARDADLTVRNTILAQPWYKFGSASRQQQLANECSNALYDAKAGNLGAAVAHLQFILERCDGSPFPSDWVLDGALAGQLWLETRNAWAAIGFLD